MSAVATESRTKERFLARAPLVVCCLLVLVFGYSVSLLLLRSRPATLEGVPLDDAWIHLCYAKSLAETGTFGWNPGVWANGDTAPLWAAVLAPFVLLFGAKATIAAKALGVVSALLLARKTGHLVERLTAPGMHWVGVGLILLHPWTAVLAVSGMEPLAASACAVGAVDAALREQRWRTGAWLACAGLLRPELALVTVLVVATCGSLRAAWRIAVIPVAAGAAWMAYGLAVTGHPLPNTFRAKAGLTGTLSQQSDALLGFVAGQAWPAAAAVGVLALVGGWVLVRRPGVERSSVFVAAALVLALVFFVPLGADIPPRFAGSVRSVYFARYAFLCVPWLLVLAAVGVSRLAARLPERRRVASAAVVLLLLGPLPWWFVERPPLLDAYGANCKEIDRVQVGMARWVDEQLPVDAVVGVSDAGALRFFSTLDARDLIGLNDHRVLDAKDPAAYLRDAGVTHAVLWSHWHGDLRSDPRVDLRRIHSVWIEHPSVSAGRSLVVYEVSVRD